VTKKTRNYEAGGDSLPQEICSLSEEQYKQLSAELKRRKRQIEDVPGLRLREMGQRASLETPQHARTPIFLADIQHLLMSALIGQKSPCRPDRWCSVEKWLSLSHSVVVILEGLSLYHYLTNESQFKATNKIFNTKLEMLLPPRDDGQILDEIAKVRLLSAITIHHINITLASTDTPHKCAGSPAHRRARFPGVGCGAQQRSHPVRKDHLPD